MKTTSPVLYFSIFSSDFAGVTVTLTWRFFAQKNARRTSRASRAFDRSDLTGLFWRIYGGYILYIYYIYIIYIYIILYIYISILYIYIPYAPWCWHIYQHLPEENHPNVGKYTIHGAYGYIYNVVPPSYHQL